MTTTERSPGIPVRIDGTFAGIVGGGGTGATEELDATVERAADLLGTAFDLPVTIRFNSDRESGGAWLKLDEPDGIWKNNQVGICASVITERTVEKRSIAIKRWGWDDVEPYTAADVGQLTVYCHLQRDIIAKDELAASLCGDSDYCHLPVPTIEHALAMALACVGELNRWQKS